MKQKNGFVLRTICGTNVVVGEGLEQINFNKMVSLNETAAYLWKELEGKEFSVEDMSALLLSKYDVSPETASADASGLAAKWLEIGIAE